MGFLDNSGDIILDAVLTDLGRMRLAKGDGSFKITQFAVGDDEINYNLYDAAAPYGSEDLSIMDTPILEAFTNNTTMLKSKLLSLDSTNHLYLPILKLNQNDPDTLMHVSANAENVFIVSADKDTAQGVSATTGATNTGIMPMGDAPINGYINGVDVSGTVKKGAFIRIDQGIDNNTELSPSTKLSAALYETQYAIEIDGRLGSIVSPDGAINATANFVRLASQGFTSDDDNIVTYYLTAETDGAFVSDIADVSESTTDTDIKGPRGSRLEFKIRTDLKAREDALYTLLGKKNVNWVQATGTNTTPTLTPMPVHYIDTIVRVTGLTTGYRLDIPIKIVKKA
tara:strand:- start:14 stop:1036 length:1023 start_codon:yes stop_codon:yes gene_type:complete